MTIALQSEYIYLRVFLKNTIWHDKMYTILLLFIAHFSLTAGTQLNPDSFVGLKIFKKKKN